MVPPHNADAVAYVVTDPVPDPTHKALEITLFELSVRVLFVRVSVVVFVIIVSVTFGSVNVTFVVCDPVSVVLVPVVPDASNFIDFVLSVLLYTANDVSTNVEDPPADVCQVAVVAFVAVSTCPVVGAVAPLTTTSALAVLN